MEYRMLRYAKPFSNRSNVSGWNGTRFSSEGMGARAGEIGLKRGGSIAEPVLHVHQPLEEAGPQLMKVFLHGLLGCVGVVLRNGGDNGPVLFSAGR